ncbi:uncharacterized protein LOC111287290 [Durio zibethinus]|uniref:Uncharacterized protein LOC111287290 n=1 Tax=Durio zibethinus TaxID=66656 RepID=A0A6P5Y0D9_DURZI|nr:uncharacterized protein LOC111287290 [Durio zibethinus]
MGNCLMRSRQLEEEEREEQLEEIRNREAATEFEKENKVGKGSIKVKIVLTKEELELFLMKLKNNSGGNSLGDLLAEMEKDRSGKVDSWRPSLESIMEDADAEGLEMDRS